MLITIDRWVLIISTSWIHLKYITALKCIHFIYKLYTIKYGINTFDRTLDQVKKIGVKIIIRIYLIVVNK